jgi:serine protease Do
VKETKGAYVAEILKDGPAAKSGLQKGDVIVAMNGKDIDGRSLRLTVGSMMPGTTVDLKVLRDGAERKYSVTLDAMPTETQRAEDNQPYPVPRRRRG